MYKHNILDIRKTLSGLTLNLYNGEPLFDQTQTDYQDFELPIDDTNNLVARILQYAGVSIREKDVFEFGKLEEQQLDQSK